MILYWQKYGEVCSALAVIYELMSGKVFSLHMWTLMRRLPVKYFAKVSRIADPISDCNHSLVTFLVIHVANVKPCAIYREKDKQNNCKKCPSDVWFVMN